MNVTAILADYRNRLPAEQIIAKHGIGAVRLRYLMRLWDTDHKRQPRCKGPYQARSEAQIWSFSWLCWNCTWGQRTGGLDTLCQALDVNDTVIECREGLHDAGQWCPRWLEALGLIRTEDEAIEQVRTYIINELFTHPYPSRQFAGRGIVIPAGGTLLIGAYVSIRLLRHLGCDLPIELWHLGPQEVAGPWRSLLEPLGVIFVDGYTVDRRQPCPHPNLYGWELKTFAIQHSRFAEVLLLDADNLVCYEPTPLFDWPDYADYGAVFWPAKGRRLARGLAAWRVFDVPYRDETEIESGQILINKEKCWWALLLANWYCRNSRSFYFRYVYGDKEVFHLAWRRLGLEYAITRDRCEVVGGKNACFYQYDPGGRRVFQHRTRCKYQLPADSNARVDGFEHEDLCLEFLRQLERSPLLAIYGGGVRLPA